MSSKVENRYRTEGLGKGILVVTAIAGGLAVLVFIDTDLRFPNLPVERVHLVAASIGIIAFSFGYCVFGLSQRGQMLVDCGPNPQRSLHLGQSVLFLLIWVLDPGNVAAVGGIGLTFMLAVGRVKLTDRGIWHCWRLLKWSKVTSWQWVEEGRLLITTTRSFQFTFAVRPGQKDAADDVLTQFCGGRFHSA